MCANCIPEVTRRDIVDHLLLKEQPFHGKLGFMEFLKRIWDLSSMPSTDPRFDTADGDIRQHMVNNHDWDLDYLLGTYLKLYTCEDSTFLRFLELCVHPRVMESTAGMESTVAEVNGYLERHGYQLCADASMSGWPVYKARRKDMCVTPRGKRRTAKPTVFKFLPLTLRLETLGGIATPVILRGTPLPAKRREVFTTAVDNQESVQICMCFGESPIAKNNRRIGSFMLKGIPSVQRGKLEVLVTLEVDRGCNITASAIERESQARVDVEFEGDETNLSNEEIGRILEKNEATKAQDERLLKSIEAKNKAESLIARAEERLREKQGSGITRSQQDGHLAKAIADLGMALQSNRSEDITARVAELETLLSYYPGRQASFDDIFSIFFSGSDLPWTPGVLSERQQEKRTPASNDVAKKARSQDEVAVPKGTSGQMGKVFGGGGFTLDPNLCFVLMPFDERMRPVYEDHIKPVVEAEGVSCVRADEIVGTGAIARDIWEKTNRARFVIADLTGRNPNVFYEVGLAHALGKDVILLAQSINDVPFDLQTLRCIVYTYDPRGAKTMEGKLRETVREIMRSS